jgi:ABC-type cobalamin/Fe3+-siderophores transport system ATPase subunit
MLRQGRVIAAGTTHEVMTPEHIRALYDVTVDVQVHGASGHLVVVPIAAAASQREGRRPIRR